MRFYVKLAAALAAPLSLAALVTTPVGEDVALGLRFAWARAYGSPGDTARVVDETQRALAESAGGAGLDTYAWGRRFRAAYAEFRAAGMSHDEAITLAGRAAGGAATPADVAVAAAAEAPSGPSCDRCGAGPCR